MKKCECSKEAITFLVHIIDGNGIRPDPEKIAAVSNFPPPTTVTELQRFLSMTSQLAKFMPNLAQIKAPLRQLLRKDQSWIWDEAQATAFKKTQDLLPPPAPPPPPVLAHYSLQSKAIVAADASVTGIGVVLTQVQDE